MNDLRLQTQTPQGTTRDQERARRLRGVLTEASIRNENVLYACTRGISQNNGSFGFRPAYLDGASGEAVLSRFANGTPAPVHLLDGLPESWILDRDHEGHVTATRPGIISGFIRDERFYTREEAIAATAH
ncbi:hypothetical protein [Thiocapsa marina]|uniref:Uncharacterized protein n=1 Tax=Thiocapsa marina 5811 TaxID=768671 RepID=F9UG63_9GAMM|nr:hypothetical protein [Thiocapsa marina]EGV16789.1 hypothetical protein ThimaDRAFT_3916 [Thiocapsa marina 5811]